MPELVEECDMLGMENVNTEEVSIVNAEGVHMAEEGKIV